ncbi:hypothetical protein CRUP_014866 [Coryphaenoides rupestris]|nr:hypothetical protein CRUP_014866 [Coryphaenoides rupestris]
MSASFRNLVSCRLATDGGPCVVNAGRYGYEYRSSPPWCPPWCPRPCPRPSVAMALYRSSMNMGAAALLCLPWRCGRGRCGRPRIDRISRCISRRSWLLRRRWMKLEWTSLSSTHREKSSTGEEERGVSTTDAMIANAIHEVLRRIESVVLGVVSALSRDEAPVLVLASRSNWANLATSKGFLSGDLSYLEQDGTRVNCLSGSAVRNITSSAKFVIVVEKDATFQRLVDDNFCSKLFPCIMITGKGFPDVNSRLMVRKLWDTLHIPIFALVDADPHEQRPVFKQPVQRLLSPPGFLAGSPAPPLSPASSIHGGTVWYKGGEGAGGGTDTREAQI